MPIRPGRAAAAAAIVAVALTLAAPAAAQGHRLRLFAGIGLQFLSHPDLDLGRGAALAGSAALRATDNVSFELGGFFGRSNRRYTATDEPVEDVIAEAIYEFRTNRYHLDGSFVYHVGRRQPFQMYVLAGGGVLRRDETRENFLYADDPAPPDDSGDGEEGEPLVTGFRQPIGREIGLRTTRYTVTAHAGAGIEVYVFDNLSARLEYRLWWPRSFSYRTQQIVIGVNLYQ